MTELEVSITNLRDRRNKFNIITVLAGYMPVKKVSINDNMVTMKFDPKETDAEKIKEFLKGKGFEVG